jgi:predicted metalloprotease with PDZ domain
VKSLSLVTLSLILLALIAGCTRVTGVSGLAAPHTTLGDTVAYSIAPQTHEGALAALLVTVAFTGSPTGETRIVLPSEWAGTDSLWTHIGELRVTGALAVRADGPNARVITHAPRARLNLSYRVTTGNDAEPGFSYHKARPLIEANWFFFHGEGVFAVPSGRQRSPAKLAWRDFPPDWKLASDLDHLAQAQGTVGDVVESVALGGPDLIVIEREAGGAPLRVALRGAWRFEPTAMADAIARVVTHSNKLWNDPGRPFLVAIAPLGGSDAGVSVHGTGRGDAFSVAATPGWELAGATRFLAHEYLHTWFPHAFGGHLTQDEALGYWFSEGFTDYYAGRVLLDAGLWTFADFVDDLNRVLLRYAASPARTANAADIATRFWTDPNVQRTPYDRGLLLALTLERAVRSATAGAAGLDDVLLEQRRRADTPAGHGDRVPAADLFPSVLRDLVGSALHGDPTRVANSGDAILLPADVFGGCASVTTLTRPDFDRGFDLAATTQANGVVHGVDRTGPAWDAGLRDGMRILRRESGVTGDSSVEVVYRVADGDAERLIRYLPAGRGEVTLQRVMITSGSTATDCPKPFGAGNE